MSGIHRNDEGPILPQLRPVAGRLPAMHAAGPRWPVGLIVAALLLAALLAAGEVMTLTFIVHHHALPAWLAATSHDASLHPLG
jgi:hypothetical protein